MLALILNRHDVREYDQIISVFTKERGRQDMLARGVKKITSKNAANLEPFSCVNIEMVQGREVSHLTKVQPVHYFSGIRAHPWKSMIAQFGMHIVKRVTQVGNRDATLFQCGYEWLSFLNTYQGTSYVTILDAFIIRIFSELGFRPIVNACVVCDMPVRTMLKQEIEGGPEKRPGCYFAGGGVVCSDCKQKKRVVGEEVFDCGIKEISLLERCLDNNWAVIADAQITKKEAAQLHRLIYQYVVYHHERSIPDWGKWCG